MGKNASGLALLTALLMGLGLLTPDPTKADTPGGEFIYNQSSGLVVNVMNARPEDGQYINLWPRNDDAKNEQFDFVDAGGGKGYKIVARHSGKCLGLYGDSKANGVQVVQWACNGGTNQLWEFVDIGDPGCIPSSDGGCGENVVGYLIQSVHSGKCLDVDNDNFPNPPQRGGLLQQWKCARTTGDPWWVNQAWGLETSGQVHPGTAVEPRPLPPMPPDSKQMVDQIIQARHDEGNCGDPSVRLDPRLSEVSRKHSEDLAANYATLIDAYPRSDPKRGHIGSGNTMPVDRIKAEGFTPAQRSENWSYGTNQTFAQAMDNWLHHDEASNWGHRAAILDCNYKVLGVGKANGHNSRVYWTQNFALR
ncbi:RICIN domain-containing protein [Streptomyces sp. NRRL S-244]|uniref:RICIN domain-containing protein n=1 Tax=Streptomyces sp. NRRL S-244 TaxID=1463897 RepID=UPI000996E37D|nr:RICIN domain-containing protein [Streptomyces sp. NRRL S-244]